MMIQKLRPSVQIRIVKSLHGTLYIYFIFNGGYEVRDKLKGLGFKYDSESKSWYKVVVNQEKHIEMLKKLRSFLSFDFPRPENGKYPKFLEIFEKIIEEKKLKRAEVIGYWCKNGLEDDFFMQLKNFEYNFFDDCFTTKPMLLHPLIILQKLPSNELLPFSEFVNETGAILRTNNRAVQYDLSDIKELKDTKVMFLKELPGWSKNDKEVVRYITKNVTVAFPACQNKFYDKTQRKCKLFDGIVFFTNT